MHYLLFYDVSDDYLERRGTFRVEHLALAREWTTVVGPGAEAPVKIRAVGEFERSFR